LNEDKNRIHLLRPLWFAFHGKEGLLEVAEQKPSFEKFNEQNVQEFVKVLKDWREKKEDTIFCNALYSGKGKFRYINWQLVDGLYNLTSQDAEKMMNEWRVEKARQSLQYQLFASLNLNDEGKSLEDITMRMPHLNGSL
jgi:hypothetical protein